jgi:hypothetical protein
MLSSPDVEIAKEAQRLLSLNPEELKRGLSVCKLPVLNKTFVKEDFNDINLAVCNLRRRIEKGELKVFSASAISREIKKIRELENVEC